MDFYEAKRIIQEKAQKEAEALGTFSIAKYLEIERRLWDEFRETQEYKQCEQNHTAMVERWKKEEPIDWDAIVEEQEDDEDED